MRALRQTAPILGPEARKRLGDTLRASFGETLNKPLPHRHRDLLQQFEHAADREKQGFQRFTGGADSGADRTIGPNTRQN